MGPIGTLKEDIDQPSFLNEKTWDRCIGLAKSISHFKDFTYMISENKSDTWKRVYEEEDCFGITLPKEMDNLSDFQRLLMYTAVRPA